MRRFVIPEKKLPDLAGMMLVIIEALREIGGSASIQELDDKVIEIENVSEDEQALEMSETDQRARVNYYLAWARTYLKRGDALENSSRGVWSLTEKGKSIQSIEATKTIYEQVQSEERERAKQKRLDKIRKKQKTNTSVEQTEPKFDESASDNEQQNEWRGRLLEVLGAMSPSGFERLAQRLLREAGFSKVEVRGKTGDGGIDGVGVLRVNLVTFQVYFQCKKWKGSVGSKEIRDFRGAMQGRADKGLFITTGRFTAQASDEATRDGAMAIDLIDGQRLCDLLKENNLGITTELVEQITVDPKWFSSI